jgi:hypothetical protein
MSTRAQQPTLRVTAGAAKVEATAPDDVRSFAMAVKSSEIGPVQYAVVAFPGGKLNNEIAGALGEAVKSGAIRIIDVAAVQTGADGKPRYLELDSVPDDFAEALDQVEGEVSGLLSQDDLENLADSLPPGSAGLFVVWEALWAKRLVALMRDSGGELVAMDYIPHDVVVTAMDALG